MNSNIFWNFSFEDADEVLGKLRERPPKNYHSARERNSDCSKRRAGL
jgi:hypothetical protein